MKHRYIFTYTCNTMITYKSNSSLMQLKILRSRHLIKVWNIHACFCNHKTKTAVNAYLTFIVVVMSAYKVVPTISKDTPYHTFSALFLYEGYFSQECLNRIEILLRLTYAIFMFHSTWRLKTTNGKYRPRRGHCRLFSFSSSIPNTWNHCLLKKQIVGQRRNRCFTL